MTSAINNKSVQIADFLVQFSHKGWLNNPINNFIPRAVIVITGGHQSSDPHCSALPRPWQLPASGSASRPPTPPPPPHPDTAMPTTVVLQLFLAVATDNNYVEGVCRYGNDIGPYPDRLTDLVNCLLPVLAPSEAVTPCLAPPQIAMRMSVGASARTANCEMLPMTKCRRIFAQIIL